MRQQINLYQAVLVDRPEPLQGRQAARIVGGFLLLLLVLGGYSFWQLTRVSQQLDEVRQQVAGTQGRVEQVERQYPVRQPNALLAQEVVRAEQQLEATKLLLGYFSTRQHGENERYLEILEGLARNPVSGVWLREILLNGNAEHVRFAGSALKAELVPQYLQHLGEHGVLNGQIFGDFRLERLQERLEHVDFILGTSRELP